MVSKKPGQAQIPLDLFITVVFDRWQWPYKDIEGEVECACCEKPFMVSDEVYTAADLNADLCHKCFNKIRRKNDKLYKRRIAGD